MKYRRRSFFFFLVLVIFPLLVSGQENRRQFQKMERSRFLRMEELFRSKVLQGAESGFDVTYYRLNLKIDPTDEIISGDVTTQAVSTVSGLKQITLDFYDNMVVDSVLSEDVSLTYTHANNALIIELPGKFNTAEIFTVTVYYHGQPMTTGGVSSHSFTFEKHGGVPIISTLSEPFGSPVWWPCKDDPNDKADSVDIIITVPDSLVVASNGTLVSEIDNGDGTKTFFWAERYPISTYLVSLAITNYEVFSDYYHYSDSDFMEVQFFVYPEHLEEAKEDFNVTVPMIEYYSSVFGEYPFVKEKYGMAEYPWWGGMEHQTCTSYGSSLIRGDHRYDWILAHELAHQWFGDLITMKRWSHIWLNEGFATYAEALWKEHIGGKKGYLSYMEKLDKGLFPMSVFVRDSTNIKALFHRTVYDKGAWVLHMLRHVMGDSSFFHALRNYSREYAFGNATTEDFRDICELTYEGDLEWFFNQWVYEHFRPIYDFFWHQSTQENNHIITLQLNQVQWAVGLFKMPLDVVLTTASGKTTIVVWDSLKTQTFEFILDEEVTHIEIDPEGWVLKYSLYSSAGLSGIQQQPERFTLSQNYPNPFNSGTVIRYNLPHQADVLLDIYDISGRRVRRLVDEWQAGGRYVVRWDGQDERGEIVSSGIYIYCFRVETGGNEEIFQRVRKMILVR